MSSASGHSSSTPSISDKLRRLPPSATGDFQRFQESGDGEALNRLIIAALADHAPDKGRNVREWSDATRLVEDLGFDSLAIAETVFFFEDLFQISISNDEILQLKTIGELRAFVLVKARRCAA